MKKKILKIILSILPVFFGYCLPNSINPAHDKYGAIIDSSFVGEWSMDGKNTSAILSIEFNKDKSYSIEIYEDKNVKKPYGNYLGVLTKIDSFLIASIKTDVDKLLDTNNISFISMIPSYFFVLLDMKNKNMMGYSLFNFDKIPDSMKNELPEISIVNLDYLQGQKVITDETAKIRSFLKYCLINNVGFEEKEKFQRILKNSKSAREEKRK